MQPDPKAVEIIKSHFTSDAIENEVNQWQESGETNTIEVINLKEAYRQLTGIKL